MSGFLDIYIKTLDDGGFQICQTGLICKVLKATGMYNCNWFPTSTKVEAPLGTDHNSSEAKRGRSNLYYFIICMMLYMASSTRPDISFGVYQCYQLIHNIKSSLTMVIIRNILLIVL